MSIKEFANTTPVSFPMVSKGTSPNDDRQVVLWASCDPCKVANNVKILIPVGIAMIMVADVKYVNVSASIPIENM
jgi:hypothetical protein